jgi:hypothetical protein
MAITSAVETITPAVATELLERNEVNRTLQRKRVEMYASDISAGRWTLNGESIVVALTGDLIDGQHRCHAVVKAGKSIKSVVVRGVKAETQQQIDQGASRSVSDVLRMRGVPNSAATASIVRWLVLAPDPGDDMAGAMRSRRVSANEAMEYVNTHPRVLVAATETTRLRAHLPTTPTVIGYCWTILDALDDGANHDFWDSLERMSFSFEHDPRKAVLRSLRTLVNDETTYDRRSVIRHVSVITRGWNLWRTGQEAPTIAVRRRGQPIPPETPK